MPNPFARFSKPGETSSGQKPVTAGAGTTVHGVALSQWDYQGILAHNTVVTVANAGLDLYGNPIADLIQGGSRVDDGVTIPTSSPLKPGYGWHLRSGTPPSPGNRIELITPLDATKDWTLESWMNNGVGDVGRVVMFGNNDTITPEEKVVEWVLFGNVQTINVDIVDANNVAIWLSGNIPATILQGIWNHCAVTFDSVLGQYNVFFNGNRIAQSPIGQPPTDDIEAVGNLNALPTVDGAWTEIRLSSGIRYSGPAYSIPAAPFTPD